MEHSLQLQLYKCSGLENTIMEVIQARPAIGRIIEKVSKEHNFNNYKIIDVKTNAKGEGYLGEIFLITIKNSHGEEKIDIVIKAAFTNDKVRGVIPIDKVFHNEINFYQNIYPEYLKLEKEHGLTEAVQIVPRFLAKSDSQLEEMLVLENLKKSGFDVISKQSLLDKDHVTLIFETYGRLHAYSYVLRDQNPEKHAKMASSLHNIYKELLQTIFAEGITEIVKILEKVLTPGEDDKIIEKFQSYLGEGCLKLFLESVTEIDDYCCLIHGDCWSNNMMFKYQVCVKISVKI